MAKTFGELNFGDIIFTLYRSCGRYFIQPRKIESKVRLSNDAFISFYIEGGYRTPQFYKQETSFYAWCSERWFTTYEECLKNLPKKQKYINILSLNGKKVKFYNIETGTTIGGWHLNKPNVGMYQVSNKIYGIISQDNLFNVIDIDNNLLSNKWFQKIKKDAKNSYLVGVNELTQKSVKNNTDYTIKCTEEEKIFLPAKCLIQKTSKT